MEFILFIALVIGGVMLFDTRSRLTRLERLWREADRTPRYWPVVEAAQPSPSQPREAEPEPVSQEPEPPAPEPVDLSLIEPAPPLETQGWTIAPRFPAATVEAAPEPEPESEPEPARSGASINFEDLFGRRLPIWAGGITLAIAGVFIVRYAIEQGWFGRIFTPGVQAVCGMLFGLGLIAGAEWAYARREKVADPRVSQALSGAGISTLYAALLVATNVYHLIAPLTAFFGVAAVTAGAMYLSLRHGAPSALLGLAGGLAAPALTAGIAENVPLLAVYLALTIGGLVGVSRLQRWPWLAGIALLGGAGWSLWLVLAGHALDAVGGLSLGGFVLLLAIAFPLLSFREQGGAVLRMIAAVVGAAQLALLVGIGGYQPLHWGLFALIAAAGQWLAWRDPAFSVVPTIGAVLSFLLLMLWPDAPGGWLIGIALALAAIHALPLLARVWLAPARLQCALELSGIALAAPVVSLRHFHSPWVAAEPVAAVVSAGAALLVLTGATLGWKLEARRGDARFALLVGVGAALTGLALWFSLPHWLAPLAIAALALALLAFAPLADDHRIEALAAGFAGAALLLLPGTTGASGAEFAALGRGLEGAVDGHALLRWAGLTAMAGLFAWRAQRRALRDVAGFGAGVLGYGALAQVLPEMALPLAAAALLLALAGWSVRAGWRGLAAPMLAMVAIAGVWAFMPLAEWIVRAAGSLLGLPMRIDGDTLALSPVLRRLAAPALAGAGALWLLRGRIAPAVAFAGAVLAALPAAIVLHCLYRMGFAALLGSDFVATGLAERLVWAGLLGGAGWLLWRRAGDLVAGRMIGTALVIAATAHAAWYNLILHNPLWAEQAVGPWPLANLITPLCAALPLGLWLLAPMLPAYAALLERGRQAAMMVMVALFGWASLRHAFHGTLLTTPGTGSAEDILRSILGIALAIGYLLWGIRSGRRDWRLASLVLMLAAVGKVFLFDASGLEGLLRIASFVALGFSLIGIGWLYSRQLRKEAVAEG